MMRVLMLVGAAAVIAVGVYFAVGGDETMMTADGGSTDGASSAAAQNDSAESGAEVAQADVDSAAEQALRDKGYAVGDNPIGSADAPVTIIEYAALSCPHCASFHVNSLPTVKKNYIDPGKARLIQRIFYFREAGLFADKIARCSGPDRYHAYIDVFFRRQRDWAFHESRADTEAAIKQVARIGGMTPDQIDACLEDEALTENLLKAYQAHTEDLQSKLAGTSDERISTPTFLVNGEVVRGDVSAEEMGEIIDGASGG